MRVAAAVINLAFMITGQMYVDAVGILFILTVLKVRNLLQCMTEKYDLITTTNFVLCPARPDMDGY